MPIQHREIPDAERHEPKGITTAPAGTAYVSAGDTVTGAWGFPDIAGQAGASEGMVLRANGAGDAVWVYPPEGFGTYQHDTTQVFNTTYSKLLSNGLGSATITGYLPFEIRGTDQLWDVTTSTIVPINPFDFYTIRVDLPITSETGSPTEVTLQMDIGTNETAPAIPIVTKYDPTGRTTPYTISIYFGYYTGSTFNANRGRLFVKTDSGTITVANANVTITRLNSGII